MPDTLPKPEPRLEWTGERFLPWVQNASLAYEHLHRYAFSVQFAKHKRVLDLGSGEGYGANILARVAASVVGIDIDETCIQHASAKYQRDNLLFQAGTFSHVPVDQDQSFDLIVCFEAIEHIHEQDALLAEVKRLLKPDGLFIVSTPNKSVYRKESSENNPYHVRELEPEEFRTLLLKYFGGCRFLGQRIHPGSSIWPLQPDETQPVEELTLQHADSEFELIEGIQRVPLYVVALASDSPAALQTAGSVLLDSSNEWFNEYDRATRELLRSKESIDAIAQLRNELSWHILQFDEMRQSVNRLLHDNYDIKTRLAQTSVELEAIYNSNSWRLLNRIWSVRDALLPAESRRRRMLKRLMRTVSSKSA